MAPKFCLHKNGTERHQLHQAFRDLPNFTGPLTFAHFGNINQGMSSFISRLSSVANNASKENLQGILQAVSLQKSGLLAKKVDVGVGGCRHSP